MEDLSQTDFQLAKIVSLIIIVLVSSAFFYFNFIQTPLDNIDYREVDSAELEGMNSKIYGQNIEFSNKAFNVKGPFKLNDTRYYLTSPVSSNKSKVIGPEQVNQNTSDKIRGMHSLYLKTLFDPLYYDTKNINTSYIETSEYKEELLGPLLEHRPVLRNNDYVAKDFVINLSESIEHSNNFLHQTSYSNARSMISSLNDTATAYDKDIADTLRIISTSPNNESKTFDLLTLWSGKKTSRKQLVESLAKMSENSIKTKKEIRNREKILEEGLDYKPRLRNVTGLNNYSPDLINSAEVKQRHQFFENYSDEKLSNVNVSDSYRIPFSCYGGNNWVGTLTGEASEEIYPKFSVRDKMPMIVKYVKSSEKENFNISDQRIFYEEEGQIGYYKDEASMTFLHCFCPFSPKTGMVRWNQINRTVSQIEEMDSLSSLETTLVQNPSWSNLEKAEDLWYNERVRALRNSESGEEVNFTRISQVRNLTMAGSSGLGSMTEPMNYILKSKNQYIDAWNLTGKSEYYYKEGDLLLAKTDSTQYGIMLGHWSDSVWRLSEKPRFYEVGGFREKISLVDNKVYQQFNNEE